MLVHIGRNHHAALEVFRAHQLGHLLEIERRANVRLGEFHAAIGPFGHGVGQGFFIGRRPAHVQLQQFGHFVGVFARLARALVEFAEQHLDLVERRPHRDHAVGQLAGLFGIERPGSRHQNFGRSFRHGPEARGLHAVMLAVVLDVLAGNRGIEQLADDFDSFEHAGRALADVGPILPQNMLVERFARAQAEPGTAGIHRGHGCSGLRHHGGVPAEGGRDHTGAKIALGAFTQRGQHVPDEGALALLGHPGLEMVGSHDAVKAFFLRIGREADGFGRMELLEHGRIADEARTPGFEG